MQNLGLVLIVFAFVCAFLAVLKLGEPYRVQLIAASLAFWTAAEIFGGIAKIYGAH